MHNNFVEDTQATIHDKVPWNTSTHAPCTVYVDLAVPICEKEKHIISSKLKIDWKTLDREKFDKVIKCGLPELNLLTKAEIYDEKQKLFPINIPEIRSSFNQRTIVERSEKLIKAAVKVSTSTKLVKNIPAIKKTWNQEIAEAVADAKKTFYQIKCQGKEMVNTEETNNVLKSKRKKVRSAHRRYNATARNKLLSNLTEATLRNDAKSVSQIIRNVNGKSYDVSPLNIDGQLLYDTKECTEKWAEYYKKLASPDERNPSMNNSYLESIQSMVKNIREYYSMNEKTRLRKVTRKDINTAISKLNNGKAQDELGLVAEHLKHSDMVQNLLMILVQKVIDEEKVNSCLKTALKTSIAKKDKDKMIQDHYRGIAITLLFMKVTEHVLLDFSELEQNTNDMQYGFTKVAAFCLTESIIEAAETMSNLIIVSLDTKKAFDLVHHDILRFKLYAKNIHPRLWNIFDSLLNNQTEKAKWGGHISAPYEVKQGTGQGKVLAAPFYKTFIEDVLENLQKLGLGFHIGDIPMECPTCADDLLIMAENALNIQLMCQNVELSSKENRSTQQPTKSKITKDIQILMNGARIPHEASFPHIGIERYLEGHNQLIQDRISTANNTVYALIPCGLHGNGLSPTIMRGLINQYVNPRLISGLQAITMSQQQRDKLYRAQLKIIKNLQCLRTQTSNAISLLLFGSLPILADLDTRILGLFGAICRLSDDQPLKRLAKRQLTIKSRTSKSWFAKMRIIGEKYGINVEVALVRDWSKESWSKYIKHAIKTYWFNDIIAEAMSKSSLKYVNFDLCNINKTHQVWPDTHQQFHITCAAYRAKMLAGSYILQSHVAKFNQFAVSKMCKMCNEEDEDMPHFLVRCKKLHKTRKYSIRIIKKKYITENDEELTSLILNGPADDKNINIECSKLCFKLHKMRMKLLNIVPKRKQKKKSDKPDDPNTCIHCKISVLDDEYGISCDSCSCWQHIRCQRILGIRKYKKIIAGIEKPPPWLCKYCKSVKKGTDRATKYP